VIRSGGNGFPLESVEYKFWEKATTAGDTQDDLVMTFGRVSLHGVVCCICLLFISCCVPLRCPRVMSYSSLSIANADSSI
jgi:hypothetical protein